MRLRRATWVAMLWVGATAIVAANPVSPGGGVVDMAGVLDVDTMLQLDSTLADYSAATGFTLSVVTVRDLADDALRDYARVSLQAYVAAQSDPEARVALLMWSSAQQFAIAVSPAFGRELSTAEVAGVLRDQVLPQVTTDAVGPGLLHGVYGLMVAAGEPSDEPPDPQELVMMARWGPDLQPDVSTDPGPAQTPPAAGTPHAGARLAVLAQEFRSAPAAALGASWTRAKTQWLELRMRVGALWAELRGSADQGNTTSFAIAGLVLLAILAGVWKGTGSLAAPAIVLGFAAAALSWGLTGYIELTVLLALSGFAVWIGLQLLRVLLARNDEPRLPNGGYPARMPTPSRVAPPAAGYEPVSVPAPATPAAADRADDAKRPAPDFLAAVQRAHRDGQRTPALEHLIAQKGTPVPAHVKKRRQFWLIAIFVCFFIAFPLVFVLLGAWALSELNRLKPPQQKLPDFLRQLWAELQLVSAQRRPRA